jgi:hypothetical protein
VAVIRERDHHLGPGAQELAVELGDRLGAVEDDLGDVRAALQIAAPLELEQVALGAENDAVAQSVEESGHEPRRLPRRRTECFSA